MSVRWPVLFCTSFISFSADYFYDVPSVIQDLLTGNATACSNGTDTCLHLSPAQFNLLYAVYAWFGACIVPFSGMLADKLGCKQTLVGFSLLFFCGSAIFASSSYMDETPAFVLMMIGRMVFGIGCTSASVVTTRMQSFWFRDHEIGLAFAISIVSGRLGSVVNFLLTESLADAIGLRWTLWFGTALCAIGLGGAVAAGHVHTRGLKKMNRNPDAENGDEPFKFKVIKEFQWSFWILALLLIFFYAGVFPFIAEAPRYFEDRYSYSQGYAGYIAGATYDVALISPLFGFLTDKVGHRGLWVLAAPAILFLGYLFLILIPGFLPLAFCLMMGVSYTLVAAIAWSCAPFLVPTNGVGTAMGLLTSFQMFGVGISNALIGVILSQGKEKMAMWADVMWFLASSAGLALLLAVGLNVSDWRSGHRLRYSQSEREKLRRDENSSDYSQERDPLVDASYVSEDVNA
ncbi:major facilitator superfamily domain-containing protein 1-like [Paramacrobiotus metropolitanus]|uniref:major facilitator superfamily domain-containing protein 1-like n=1 Tax=Paramacrobiotus metropolitanus TaxID=2943436 RepID=UPI0024460D33|nr:major facilitator superfamily domain-containing protein 1-like [Paramacrobiotus metropolitanus]